MFDIEVFLSFFYSILFIFHSFFLSPAFANVIPSPLSAFLITKGTLASFLNSAKNCQVKKKLLNLKKRFHYKKVIEYSVSMLTNKYIMAFALNKCF